MSDDRQEMEIPNLIYGLADGEKDLMRVWTNNFHNFRRGCGLDFKGCEMKKIHVIILGIGIMILYLFCLLELIRWKEKKWFGKLAGIGIG